MINRPPLAEFRSGPLSRREWLRLGGLSLGALSGGNAFNLAALRASENSFPNMDRQFSVILFWANGGPSHIDLFDLKPQAPSEYRGPFRPIATNVPGIEINEHLPKLAAMAHRWTLIRSLRHERNEHSGGTHRFLTGYSSRAANLNDAENPEIGSNVARELAHRQQDVPTFVANTKLYGSGPAYLGPGFAPYMPNPNPVSSTGNNTYDPIPIYSTGGRDDLAMTPDGVVTFDRRRGLLQSLESLSGKLDLIPTLGPAGSIQQQALAMLTSSRTRDAFDLSLESAATRELYGETHWGRSLLTCRRLVEAGVRFVQCQAEFRLPAGVGVTSNWDDHSVNSDIFAAYRLKLPCLDQSVSALIKDLDQRGLSDRVLFIFCGEFGRTPKIYYQDASKRPGRDHWASAMSVFLAGGGLRMGQVIGSTNSKAEEPVQRSMDSNCLLATLYSRFGIDPRRTHIDNSGRPLSLLPQGDVIRELF